MAALIILSVCSQPWPSHSGAEEIPCCYCDRTEHCDTSEAARPLLCRTNWSFNYWSLFLSVCASGFGIHIPDFDVQLHVCVVLSVHAGLECLCIFVFFALQNKVQQRLKKEKNCESFFFGIPQLAEEQCFIKCHNVPESFIKKSVGLFLS